MFLSNDRISKLLPLSALFPAYPNVNTDDGDVRCIKRSDVSGHSEIPDRLTKQRILIGGRDDFQLFRRLVVTLTERKGFKFRYPRSPLQGSALTSHPQPEP